MHRRRTFLLGLAASACTPAGDSHRPPAKPRTSPHLLPGEKVVAFARWPRDRATLTVYASGHLDYRTIEPALEGRSRLERRAFRLADGSVNDALKLARHFGAPGFLQADRAYGTDPSGAVSLYAPRHGRTVDVAGTTFSVPRAVTEALHVVNSLRTYAAEAGTDPFSDRAHRVVSPLLVYTHRREDEGYIQEVSVFDNGALELRRVPTPSSQADPWIASRRVRAGTMVELQELVGNVDADDGSARPQVVSRTRELITARTRRSFHSIPSPATRALLDRTQRIISTLEPVA